MSAYTGRPAADEYVPAFGGYIGHVPAGDIVEIMRQQLSGTRALLEPLTTAQAEFAYGPDKWTIKEVVGHLGDTERVMGYRALRFARGDETPLAGFDENAWVPAASFNQRTMRELLDELVTVRAASAALFSGLPIDTWERRGTSNGRTFSVRALACIITGHELHHRDILKTRYLASPAFPR